MEPEIQERPAFRILGVTVRARPPEADYTDLWHHRFQPRQPEIAPRSTDGAYYAVYFCTGQDGLADIVAGMRVQGVDTAPEGLVLREVPAGREAVFACTNEGIGPTWGRIYGGWLEDSGLQHDPLAPDYERFPADFKEGSDKLTIHVPVL